MSTIIINVLLVVVIVVSGVVLTAFGLVPPAENPQGSPKSGQ